MNSHKNAVDKFEKTATDASVYRSPDIRRHSANAEDYEQVTVAAK